MENEYPGLATVFTNEADWSLVIPTLLLSRNPNDVETSNKVRQENCFIIKLEIKFCIYLF
jgi:hypothetical protein